MKVVDLQQLSRPAALAAMEASSRLPAEQHDEDCPVKHGVSVDCVFPFAACVPDDFEPDDFEPTAAPLRLDEVHTAAEVERYVQLCVERGWCVGLLEERVARLYANGTAAGRRLIEQGQEEIRAAVALDGALSRAAERYELTLVWPVM